MELVNQNAVVSSQAFNVAIISQPWLIRNEIISEEELAGSIFTPALVQLSTKRFEMMFVSERIQVTLPPSSEDANEVIQKTAGKVVEVLPHTPYVAVGLNFNWHLPVPDTSTHRIGSKLFFKSDGPLGDEFASDDSKYGAYLSKDCLGMRLKLSILPVNTASSAGPVEKYLLGFNFHHETKEPSSILQKLSLWGEAKSYAERIVKKVAAAI